jgi:hypothetical protein
MQLADLGLQLGVVDEDNFEVPDVPNYRCRHRLTC